MATSNPNSNQDLLERYRADRDSQMQLSKSESWRREEAADGAFWKSLRALAAFGCAVLVVGAVFTVYQKFSKNQSEIASISERLKSVESALLEQQQESSAQKMRVQSIEAEVQSRLTSQDRLLESLNRRTNHPPVGQESDSSIQEGSNLPPETMAVHTHTDTYFCDSCKKEVTVADLRSGKCPYCKTDFVTNPFGPTNDLEKWVPVREVNNWSASPIQSGVTPTVIEQDGGFAFDSIPNWAKGGLFALLVMLGYHMIFNR